MTERNQAAAAPRERLLELLKRGSLDGALVLASANRRYLTGFSAVDHAPDESMGVCLVGRDGATLFTSGVNVEWARSQADGIEVEAWKRPWEPFIAEEIARRGWRRVGYEDRALVVASFTVLQEKARSVSWDALGDRIDRLRARKSAAEIATIARAIAATDAAFARAMQRIAPGMTERRFARLIEDAIREETGNDPAFGTIVASGPHAARPHHDPTDRLLAEGEPIVIDMGAQIDGYCGDLTRTVWVGSPSPRTLDVYNVVREAHAAAVRGIAPGVPVRDVDQAARDVITAAGLESGIVHAVGHGLGLRVHEAPSVSIASDEILEPGHVVTVEPGIYLTDWGGVRIEDVVVVTDDGHRMLTNAAKLG